MAGDRFTLEVDSSSALHDDRDAKIARRQLQWNRKHLNTGQPAVPADDSIVSAVFDAHMHVEWIPIRSCFGVHTQ